MSLLALAACLGCMMSASFMDLEPARLVQGAAPQQPCEVIGGGQVFLELAVGADGTVRDAKTLRHTPPFTGCLRCAVADWQFAPRSHSWRTLVAGVFRPPAFHDPTLGEVPREIAVACREVPYPLRVVTPVYPPRALGNGVVVVRLDVADDGHVDGLQPGFDDVALSAAREWQFRPARKGGHEIPAVAFLIFGFRAPVTPPNGE